MYIPPSITRGISKVEAPSRTGSLAARGSPKAVLQTHTETTGLSFNRCLAYLMFDPPVAVPLRQRLG